VVFLVVLVVLIWALLHTVAVRPDWTLDIWTRSILVWVICVGGVETVVSALYGTGLIGPSHTLKQIIYLVALTIDLLLLRIVVTLVMGVRPASTRHWR
jgi:hypothetical protein